MTIPWKLDSFLAENTVFFYPFKKTVFSYYLLNRYSLPMEITDSSVSKLAAQWEGDQEFCFESIQAVIWKCRMMFTNLDAVCYLEGFHLYKCFSKFKFGDGRRYT